MRFRRTMPVAALLICVLAAPAVSGAEEAKPAPKKAQSRPAATQPKKAPQTQPAPEANVPEQIQGGVMVRENYFLDLPGFDLSTLTPKQKEKFLDRVNKEMCTCGCPNDTIARCLVNDPTCSVVKGLAEKVLSEVKAGQ